MAAVNAFTPGPWSVELDLANEGDINVVADEWCALALVDVRDDPDEFNGQQRVTIRLKVEKVIRHG